MVNKIEFTEITSDRILLADENLPVTKKFLNQHKGALNNYVILHINHTLADVYAFNEYLCNDLGAKLFFIGIPYSNKYAKNTKYVQLYSLRDPDLLFVPFENGEVLLELKPEKDYIDLLKEQIKYIIKNYVSAELVKGKKLILIQDGGYTTFIREENKSFLNSLKGFVGIIEQTGSGTRLIEDAYNQGMNNYPTISIAKSEIKSSVEAQFICDSIFASTHSVFKQMGMFLNYKSVIIGGYGIIGRSLALLMRSIGIHIRIKEIDPIIKTLAEREGFQVRTSLAREDFEDSVLYLGCTGVESFDMVQLAVFLKSNTLEYFLTSGSSKRIEFWPVIKTFEQLWLTSKDDLVQQYPFLSKISAFDIKSSASGLTYNFHLDNGIHKKLHLLGEGFPINFFDPSNDGIPNRAIDLTQCSLLSACIVLAQQHEAMDNDLYLYKHKSKIGSYEVDENKILSIWLAENDINLNYSYPLEHFNLHPLREYLLNRTRKKYAKN